MASVIEFTTGLHTGTVNLEVRLEPEQPRADLEQWDDVVEVPFHSDTAPLILSSIDGSITELIMPVGTYRARLSGRGIDAAHDADTGNGIDTYQLVFWPDQLRPDDILKQTSATVAYQHRTYGR